MYRLRFEAYELIGQVVDDIGIGAEGALRYAISVAQMLPIVIGFFGSAKLRPSC